MRGMRHLTVLFLRLMVCALIVSFIGLSYSPTDRRRKQVPCGVGQRRRKKKILRGAPVSFVCVFVLSGRRPPTPQRESDAPEPERLFDSVSSFLFSFFLLSFWDDGETIRRRV
jgi:hypothetical protein